MFKVGAWARSARAVRLLLTALLVPLVVVTQTGTAQAASSVGVALDFSFTNPLWSDVGCRLNLAPSPLGGKVTVSGACRGGVDLAPGQASPGEAGSRAVLWLEGSGAAAPAAEEVTLTDHGDDSVWRVAGTIPAVTFEYDPLFAPAVLCMKLGASSGGDVSFAQACGKAEIPPLTQCPYQNPEVVPSAGPSYQWSQYASGAGYQRWRLPAEASMRGTGTVGPSNYNRVRMYVVFEGVSSNQYRTLSGTQLRLVQDWFSVGRSVVTDSEQLWDISAQWHANYPADALPDPVTRIVGIGFMPWLTTDTTLGPHLELPGALTPQGRIGMSDPGACYWYFGERLYDDGTPKSEPLGPIGDADDGGEVPVEFPEDTPDEESWWSALWAILRSVVSMLGRVVAAIGGLVAGITDALITLLVPDEFPDFSEVVMPIPDGWVPEFPDLGGGGCGEVGGFSLTLPVVGSVQGAAFVDTCEAPWSTVRTVVYYGLLSAVLVTLGNRVLRVVMAGFGMAVDAPSAGGDD